MLSFLTNDIETVNQTLNEGVTQIIYLRGDSGGYTIMMFSISWQMTIIGAADRTDLIYWWW